MNDLKRRSYAWCLTISVMCGIALSIVPGPEHSFATQPEISTAPRETLRLGERIYREGVLPSGEPLQASLKGGAVPGTTFACASCHLRSGLGAFEGNVYTPPANGANLFKPFQVYQPVSDEPNPFPFNPGQLVQQHLKKYQTLRPRPAYTDASLADALRKGVDSNGRTMDDAMPRYLLDDKEMKLLITYLKSLSTEFSPGVSDTTIRFATIITDATTPEEQRAMLVPLENYIRNTNQKNLLDPQAWDRATRDRSTSYRSRLMAETMLTPKQTGIRKLSLSRWVLKGAPDTWRKQLEEYYRKEPVFAILGGMTHGEWQPIHQFCEENHIPNIFPITDFPVISQTDWYTLYFSKGYYQEGEGAASFLNARDEVKDKPILHIVRDTDAGRALAKGFLETWRDFGHKAPMTMTLKAGEPLTAERLQQELAREKPAALVLWDGADALKTLEMTAAVKDRPAMVLVSSSFLGTSMFSLGKQVQEFTYITYPYGISPTLQEKSSATMGVKNFNVQANAAAAVRASQQSYILTLILEQAFIDMRGNYYRDYLLDVIGTIMDPNVPLYDHLNFGAGQRYASKGCYIVQLAKDGLVKKSGWLNNWATP